MADVKYIITADAKGAVKQIDKVDKSIDGMKTQAKQSVSPLKGMFTQLATGLLATVAIGTAMRKLVGFMKDAVEKAKEQELAEKGLTDALASTGREVPVNAAHFKAYASELQSATRYGDEAILGAQALLIQLTDLDEKGLDRATAGALGMATVFKTDLKSATNLIAKALAGNYGALSRYGISVTDLNTEEEKRASLLDQLGTLYERAKGETDTYEGAVTQLKNTYGDFKEKIGDVIVESEELRGGIQSIQLLMSNFVDSGVMDDWASKFDLIVKNVPIFKALKDSIFILNLEMEGQIAKQKAATETGEKWYDFLKDSDEQLKFLGVDLYEAMRKLAGFDKVVEVSGSTTIPKLATSVKEAELKLFDMNDVVEDSIIWLELMKLEGEELGDVMGPILESLGLDFKDMGEEIQTVVTDAQRNLEALGMDLSRSFGDAFKSITTKGSDEIDALEILFEGLVNSVRGFFAQMVTDFLANNVFDFMKTAATEATSSVASTVGGLAKGAAGAAAGAGPGALAMGLGAAAGTFLGTMLGGGGMPSSSMEHFRLIHENTTNILNTLRIDMRDGQFNRMLGHLGESQKHLFAIQARADVRNRLLTSIEKNLKGSVSAQGGLHGTLRQDTLIRAHKGEDVSISPRRGSSNLWNASKYGQQKIHERAIIKR